MSEVSVKVKLRATATSSVACCVLEQRADTVTLDENANLRRAELLSSLGKTTASLAHIDQFAMAGRRSDQLVELIRLFREPRQELIHLLQVC